MAKLKTRLRKMSEGDVKYLSLVERAASRIPFRIMKSADKESEMIDLGNPRKMIARKSDTQKAEVTAPAEVLSVVVEKSDNMDGIKAAIVESGFSVDNPKEHEDGTIEFVQKEEDEGDRQLFRLNEHAVLVTKGFAPWNGMVKDFNEMVKAQGFHNGLCMATDALKAVITDSLYGSDTPKEALPSVKSALTAFASYVEALVTGLPESAFVLTRKSEEVAVEETASTVQKADEEVEAAAATTETAAAGTEVATDTGAEAEAANAEAAAAGTEGEDVAAAAAATTGEESVETVQKTDSEDDKYGKILALVENLTTVVKAEVQKVSERVEEVARKSEEALESVEAKVATAIQKSEKVEQSVSATVVAASSPDAAPEAGVQVRKSEDHRSGNFDTAFINRNRK